MKLTALFLALIAAALPAAAQGNDLVNCTYGSTGLAISPNVCDLLRQKDAEDRAAKAEQARQEAFSAERAERAERARAAAAQEGSEHAAKVQAQAVADQAERERQAEAKAKAEAARWAAADAQRRAAGDKAMREIESAEEQHERRMAQLQRECGADFQAPRVGMSLARAKRCVGDLKLYGQNGPVSAYRAGPLLLSVVGGKVTKWVVFQGL